MTAIDRITTANAPKPAGHYSQGCGYGSLIFVSGRLTLGNVLAILKAAGSGPDRVLKVTAFIVGVENWPAFNRVYAELFGDARPARSVVPVGSLHHGCLVEIEAVAARGA